MTRAALLLPSLFLAACTVGEIPTNHAGGDDAPSNGCMPAQPVASLTLKHMHAASGTDNAGMDCSTMSGCHNKAGLGTGAPAFRFAATIYAADGTTPVPGASVLFTTGSAAPIAYVTDTGGNFNVMDGDTTIPEPFTGMVAVTACPGISHMVAAPGDAVCGNNAACHTPTGTGGKMIIPAM